MKKLSAWGYMRTIVDDPLYAFACANLKCMGTLDHRGRVVVPHRKGCQTAEVEAKLERLEKATKARRKR